MLRKFFLISLIVLLVFLGLNRAKAKPASNVSLLLSPFGKYAKWIDAQSRHETADPKPYESRAYRENNNLFGMKNATMGRKDSQLGKAKEGDKYRVYSSPGESIRDLIQWFQFTKFPTNLSSPEAYVLALKERDYFTDTVQNYTNGLKRFL